MEISEKTTEALVQLALPSAISYTDYRNLVSEHAANETTTGPIQTEALSEYTQLNNARMRRLDKTLRIQEKVVADRGPRPSNATKMVEDFKMKHQVLTPEFKKELQVWYTKDKGQNIFEDLASLLSQSWPGKL